MKTSSKNPIGWAAIDMLICLMLVFLVMMNPPKRTHAPSIPTYGKYAIIVTWKDGSHDDVDTYVQDPQDHIVNFVTPSTGLMHLEQDDLGTGYTNSTTVNGQTVQTKRNQERVIITGIVPGEYTVNVQMFQKRDPGSQRVTVELIRLEGQDAVVIKQTVVLAKSGDEKTAFRFTLRQSGSMCCVNHIFKDLVYAGNTPNYSVPPPDPGQNYGYPNHP